MKHTGVLVPLVAHLHIQLRNLYRYSVDSRVLLAGVRASSRETDGAKNPGRASHLLKSQGTASLKSTKQHCCCIPHWCK